uniref:CUB domain-containing protein n=1 Tax=Caenorhabditis japonica TaxID=281687 RepID=A0A8R1DXT3_CAEJA
MLYVRLATLLVIGLLASPLTCDGSLVEGNDDVSSESTAVSSTVPATNEPTSAPASLTTVATVPATNEPTSTPASLPPVSTVDVTNEPTSTPASLPPVSTVNVTNEPTSTPASLPTVATEGSTVSHGPTAEPPLPDVPSKLLTFSPATCDNTTCTYQFEAPGNDQALLATENSVVDSDRADYKSLETAADQKDADARNANNAAASKIAKLRQMLDEIQDNWNLIGGSIVVIQSQQSAAKNTLNFVQKFIDEIRATPQCLYDQCLKPTTPAPPTTTPTPAPTTPPSPCFNFTCPPNDVESHCQLDIYKKPYCNNCDGNLDGYEHCQAVTCDSDGVPFSNTGGVLYSTGYNLSDPESSVVPVNADCRWQLNGAFQVAETDTDKYNLTCLISGNVLMYVFNQGSAIQRIGSGLNIKNMNRLLENLPNAIFSLVSTKSEPSYCTIPLGVKTGGSLERRPNNGFFSWLLGY